MTILTSNTEPQILLSNGPLVNVEVYQTPALLKLQSGEHGHLPQPFIGSFLIDTGSSITTIKPHIVKQLGLKQVSEIDVSTPNQKSRHGVFVAGLKIMAKDQTISFDILQVVEMPLFDQRIDGLIGRDILYSKLFIYSGFTGAYTIAV